MDKFLSITVAGLATGAIYAVAASGLVLTYSTTGVFNFAHGAIGMVAAFLYWQLHYAWGWPTPVALAAVLLVAGPLFGAGMERIIMRRLDGTSEATRLVVTTSVLLGLLGTAVAIWGPGENRPLRQFFQGNVVTLGGVRIPWHQLIALAVAALVALGLRILLYRTRRGVTMRASVDNRQLTALTGARPERSSMLAWAIGCSLAALSGLLVAPTLTLSAVPLTLLIVNAYGAAVFGRLRSLPMTFLGAVVLGLATAYGIGYISEAPTDVQPYVRGLVDAIPAIVLLIVVLLLPATRLGNVVRTREIAVKPTWSGALTLAVGVVVVTAMSVPLLTDSDLVSIGVVWGLAIVGLSMVPLIGLAGQLSLAQVTFAAVGAIAYAHLGWTGPLGLLWAGAAGAAIAALVALPVLRLDGIYVALATGAFAVLCDRWLFQLPEFTIGSHTFAMFQGGTLQMSRPELFGLDLRSPSAYFVYSSVVFALLVLVVVWVRRSRFGARLIAVKEGPAAVATSGINVTALKLAVFALSGAIAGVGGAVLTGAKPVTSSSLDFVSGLPLLLSMFIAGISSVAAPIAAGVFLGSTLTTKLLSGFFDFGRWQNSLIALAGIGLGNNPNGLTSDLRPVGARLKNDAPVLGALVLVLVALWGIRVGDVISNGPFVVLSLVALVAAPVLAGRRAGPADARSGEPHSGDLDAVVLTTAAPGGPSTNGHRTPPELLGLTAPFTAADVAALDDALELVTAERRLPRESHAAG